MMNARYAGVNAAVLTPMGDDLAPDLGRMAEFCAWLLAHGCDGLTVLGTTGEANSLGIAERIAVLEGLVRAGLPPGRMLPGLGTPAITDTVTLIREAAALGYPAALVLPPFFYKNPSDDGLFAFFSEVINRVGAGTDIYLYHFPQQSAVPFSLDLIARLLRAFPTTVRGIKDSSGDFTNTAALAREFGPVGFEVYGGDDSAFLALLRAGGAGCITGGGNVTSAAAQTVYANRGDPAAAEPAQARLSALRKAIGVAPSLIPALKALVARRLDDPTWTNARPPHLRLSVEATARLFASVDALGFEPGIG